jgi:DNA-binding XRE family transcriptional regulator
MSRRGILSQVSPTLLVCHACLSEWDSRNRCFVCPKCHTVFNPELSRSGFGGQILAARLRTGTTQAALAKIIGCHHRTIYCIESGKSADRPMAKVKLYRERLRIWVESTKSPIDKRKEIDDMFKENKDA